MDVQNQMLSRGSLAEVRNPSAACIRRVRDAKKLGHVSPVEQVIAEEGVHKMFFFLQNPRNFKNIRLILGSMDWMASCLAGDPIPARKKGQVYIYSQRD